MQEYIDMLLPSSDGSVILFLIATFFISGVVKGFLGIGLPAAAMALMTLVMEPTTAISLLFIPLFFTNLAQYSRAQKPLSIAKSYRYFALALALSIFVTASFIKSFPQSFLTITIGAVMIIFSVQAFFGIRIPVKENILWHSGIGACSGVLGGLSGIWSPPVAMYLLSRGYSKEDFIGITGFLFLVGSLPLGLGLYLAGVVNLQSSLQSIIGLLFVLLGFRIGEIFRLRVTPDLFRKLLLIAFFFMGVRLVLISIL